MGTSRLTLFPAVVALGTASSLVAACATGSLVEDGTTTGAVATHPRHPASKDAGPGEDASSRETEPAMPRPEAGKEAAPDTGIADVYLDWLDFGDADADAGAEAEAAAPDAAVCTSTIAITGGTTSSAFGAVSTGGAPFTVTSLAAGSMSTSPTIVAFGGGFLALFTAGGTGDLQYSTYAGSAWAAPSNAFASACPGPAQAIGPAVVAPSGTTLNSVYLGTDNDFFHGSYTTTGWDCESDPLTPSGGVQSFGPSAPSAATVGTSLVAAFDGADTSLYTQTQTSGVWAAAAAVTGATVGTVPPTLIALTGGTSDLLVVYENAGDNKLYFATRTKGTWSAPALTNINAFTLSQASVAPLAGGAAVLAYLGTDGNPYGMTFDPTAATPWTAPVALATGLSSLPSAPSVATGVCGADAVAAFVQPAGVEVVTLSAGTWSAPSVVTGTASMTYATVATAP